MELVITFFIPFQRVVASMVIFVIWIMCNSQIRTIAGKQAQATVCIQ